MWAFKINRLTFVWPLQFKIAHINSTPSHSSSFLDALNITAVLRWSKRNWKYCVCADKLKKAFCPQETETQMRGRVECKCGLTPFSEKAEWLEIAEWLCCKSAISEPQVAETELYRCPLLQPSGLDQAGGNQVLLPQGRVWEYSPEYGQDSGAGGICSGFQGALHCQLLLSSPDLWATAELLLPQSSLCWALGAGLDTWGWIRFEGRALPCSLQLTRCGGEGSTELCNVLANLGCCCERGFCNFPEWIMPDESNVSAVLLNLGSHLNVQI